MSGFIRRGLAAAAEAIGNFFAEVFFAFADRIAIVYFSLWTWLARFMNVMEDLFRMLAGVDPLEGDNSHLTGETVAAGETNIVMMILGSQFVQNVFIALMSVAIVLLIFFTILQLVRNQYKSKDGGNPYMQVFKMFKGMILFIFITAAVFVGLFLSGVVFRMLEEAISPGDRRHMTALMFNAAASDANRLRMNPLDYTWIDQNERRFNAIVEPSMNDDRAHYRLTTEQILIADSEEVYQSWVHGDTDFPSGLRRFEVVLEYEILDSTRFQDRVYWRWDESTPPVMVIYNTVFADMTIPMRPADDFVNNTSWAPIMETNRQRQPLEFFTQSTARPIIAGVNALYSVNEDPDGWESEILARPPYVAMVNSIEQSYLQITQLLEDTFGAAGGREAIRAFFESNVEFGAVRTPIDENRLVPPPASTVLPPPGYGPGRHAWIDITQWDHVQGERWHFTFWFLGLDDDDGNIDPVQNLLDNWENNHAPVITLTFGNQAVPVGTVGGFARGHGGDPQWVSFTTRIPTARPAAGLSSDQLELMAEWIDINMTLMDPIFFLDFLAAEGADVDTDDSALQQLGVFHYTNAAAVVHMYNVFEMSFILLWLGMFIIFGVFMNFAFGLIQRLVELTLLYMLSPLTVAFYPFDDGQSFKSAFAQPFYKKVLSMYGVLLSLNIFFILYPVISSIQFFPEQPGLGNWRNALTGILVTLAMLTMLPNIRNQINSMLGADSISEKKMGQVWKDAVGATVGQGGAMTAGLTNKLNKAGDQSLLATARDAGKGVHSAAHKGAKQVTRIGRIMEKTRDMKNSLGYGKDMRDQAFQLHKGKEGERAAAHEKRMLAEKMKQWGIKDFKDKGTEDKVKAQIAKKAAAMAKAETHSMTDADMRAAKQKAGVGNRMMASTMNQIFNPASFMNRDPEKSILHAMSHEGRMQESEKQDKKWEAHIKGKMATKVEQMKERHITNQHADEMLEFQRLMEEGTGKNLTGNELMQFVKDNLSKGQGHFADIMDSTGIAAVLGDAVGQFAQEDHKEIAQALKLGSEDAIKKALQKINPNIDLDFADIAKRADTVMKNRLSNVDGMNSFIHENIAKGDREAFKGLLNAGNMEEIEKKFGSRIADGVHMTLAQGGIENTDDVMAAKRAIFNMEMFDRADKQEGLMKRQVHVLGLDHGQAGRDKVLEYMEMLGATKYDQVAKDLGAGATDDQIKAEMRNRTKNLENWESKNISARKIWEIDNSEKFMDNVGGGLIVGAAKEILDASMFRMRDIDPSLIQAFAKDEKATDLLAKGNVEQLAQMMRKIAQSGGDDDQGMTALAAHVKNDNKMRDSLMRYAQVYEAIGDTGDMLRGAGIDEAKNSMSKLMVIGHQQMLKSVLEAAVGGYAGDEDHARRERTRLVAKITADIARARSDGFEDVARALEEGLAHQGDGGGDVAKMKEAMGNAKKKVDAHMLNVTDQSLKMVYNGITESAQSLAGILATEMQSSEQIDVYRKAMKALDKGTNPITLGKLEKPDAK